MKKLLYSLFTGLCVFTQAQNPIPNGNFENWNDVSYYDPLGYESSNKWVVQSFTSPNVERVTDAYSGTYALKMTNVTNGVDTLDAFIANGNPEDLDGQGIPYSEVPTGIRGYYKSNIQPGDTATILLFFKGNGNVLDTFIFRLTGVASNYTLFEFPFPTAISGTPDSLVFIVTPGNAFFASGYPGSMLQLDSISFTGVATQPALFNGDFENWTLKTSSNLIGWSINDNNVNKSTDANSGSYALELVTYLEGDSARSPFASTGVSVSNGTIGGYPFTNQVDTAVFYYKYTPADPNDSASIQFAFKAGGVTQMNMEKDLVAANSYQYIEVPFNLSFTPDSLIIFINSSKNWKVSASYAGATLKIDDLRFKSQLAPVAAFSAPDSVCQGELFTLTDSSSESPSSWSWTMTGASPSGTSSMQNPQIYFAGAGTFTVTLAAANAAGSSATVNKTITVLAAPGISTTGDIICAGDSATISASGTGISYVWSSGDSTATATVSPAGTSVYTVTAWASNGCASIDSATVTVNALPTVSIVSSLGDTICSGDALTLSGSGAVSYTWTNGVTDGAAFVPANDTTYTVTGTDAANCSASASITITLEACLGIKNSGNENVISVYPNPFTNSAVITGIQNNTSIALYDLAGRLVKNICSNQGSAYVTLNREGLENGIYFIRVSSEGKVISNSKIVVE
jgi:hypothetical protein